MKPWSYNARGNVRLAAAAFLAVAAWTLPALAQNPGDPNVVGPVQNKGPDFIPQVGLPVSGPEAAPFVEAGKPTVASARLLGQYIATIYRFVVWLAIFLAIVMTMVGGFLWLIAGGSSERVSSAKGYIGGAMTGLVVALTSFLMLQTVNPRLVELSIPEPQSISPLATKKALSPTGCAPQLTVQDRAGCPAACQSAGFEGPYIPDKNKSEEWIAVPMVGSEPASYCCACKTCIYDLTRNCALGGTPCCAPLMCNTARERCSNKVDGSPEYTKESACARDVECKSNMCFASSYCVPVGGFDPGHECENTPQCKQGNGCWKLPASIFYWPDPTCNPLLGSGELCTDDFQCRSGQCDPNTKKCT